MHRIGRRAAALVLLLLPFVASAQAPPIAIRISPKSGWEEAQAGEGAAAVLKKREQGRVVGAVTVVISESKDARTGSITDPGVAAGLEHELMSAVPGATPRARSVARVAGFDAVRVTVDVTLQGKPKVICQVTVDVRRGAVTITAVVDAARADALLAEFDAMVGAMAIDA